MTTYFIPGVTADQKSTLAAGFISFHELTVGEESGVILEEGYLQPALVTLRCRQKSQGPSLYEGIVRFLIEVDADAAAVVDQAPPPELPDLSVTGVAQPGDLFVEECSKALGRHLLISGNDAGFDQCEQIKKLRENLAKQLRAAKALELQLMRNDGFTTERFGDEYDLLYRVPKVRDVRVENGKITVYTEVLYLRHYNREIGAFRIELNPDAESPLWFNLTRTVNALSANQNAPHIWSNGTACLGNTAQAFKQLFTQRQWSVAAAYAIEFVESVNVNDQAGARYKCWPAITTQQEPAAKPASYDAEHLQFRANYMAACSARMSEVVALTRQDLVLQRLSIERIEATLVEQLRTKYIVGRRQSGLALCDRSGFAAQLAALLDMTKVERIIVDPGIINLFTRNLFSVDPQSKQTHDIGSFQIRIHLDGRGDCIRWLNQVRRVDGCLKEQQAPQVLGSGRACLSEIKESFPDLIASMQLSIVAQLAIAFIEQVNAQDPSAENLNNWPVAN